MTLMTLEEAQAEIVRLTDELTERTNERDTLSQNNADLTEEMNKIRSINQQYFNRLMAQNSEQAGGTHEEDEEAPTCEEFAKTLNI